MAKTKNSASVTLVGGTLNLAQAGVFTIKSNNGVIQIKGPDGTTTVLKHAELATVTSITLAPGASLAPSSDLFTLLDIGFVEANVAGNSKFETTVNVDAVLQSLIAQQGLAAAFDTIATGVGQVDAFKILWDYLDDNYTSYFSNVNADFIRLGVKYLEYLEAGGEPLYDVIAKYAPDGSDSGTAPDRVQSMHDNLLGNFNQSDFDVRFANEPTLKASLAALATGVVPDIFSRGAYSGSEGAVNTTLAFDLTHDYLELSDLNIGFVEANVASNNYKFEPTKNIDAALSQLITERGVTETIDILGGEADAFKVLWDHLDDNYSYYNTAVNDAFIDLAIAYSGYLLEGGDRLVEIAKYAPDSADDADTTPERMQTLHDNILGNLHEASIADKFGAGADAILDRIEDAGLGAFIGQRGDFTDGRAYYGGFDHESATATILFDQIFG